MSTFTAIADPVRRDILALLASGELPAGRWWRGSACPARRFEASEGAEAGRAGPHAIDGPRRLYSLDPTPLAELDAWLAPYRAFWAGKLDALGDHLKRTD